MTQKIEYVNFATSDFFQSLLILFIQMLGCYVVINILLSRFLLKGKYLLFAASIILLGTAIVIATHFVNVALIPFLDNVILNNKLNAVNKTTYWFSISNGGINFIKIITTAMVIKVAKRWWFKQKEKERLEKEKIDTELQLLKAQIHPGFLFNTLNNIYSSALIASPKAPEMLLKLSEILSYMLYECNDPVVPVDKEIKMLKNYMALEKTRFGDKLEMNIMVKGSVSEEKIAPLLLLHFIENSFNQCSSKMTEQPWINLEIKIENHILDMKLMNGKPPGKQISEEPEEDVLYQVHRRLELLYPNRFELEITEEPEIMMVSLQIKLQELSEKNEPLIGKKKESVDILQEV
ncbi:MAG: histidine kinase [Chitinophagaceae bacterium]